MLTEHETIPSFLEKPTEGIDFAVDTDPAECEAFFFQKERGGAFGFFFARLPLGHLMRGDDPNEPNIHVRADGSKYVDPGEYLARPRERQQARKLYEMDLLGLRGRSSKTFTRSSTPAKGPDNS